MNRAETGGSIERLRLLVFSAGSLRFAADADQLAQLREYDPSANQCGTCWFHEAVGLDGVDREAVVRPEVYVVRQGAQEYGFITNAPEDLIERDAGSLRPLPSLVEPFSLVRGIWAALPVERYGIILLVDFFRLAASPGLRSGQGDTP